MITQSLPWRGKTIRLLVYSCALMMFSLGAVQPPEQDVDAAYQNAKRGLQWGLSNLKAKKSKLENKLIANDKLIASVRIEKEINGVTVRVTGYDGTTEVSITTYRSFETLVKEGYVDKNFIPKPDDE